MYGAILGDIIGSPYEFDQGNKTKEFPLFSKLSTFTDDSVMTIAVAEATMDLLHEAHGARNKMIASMKKYGKLFPRAGYGSMFRRWLQWDEPQPYGSYGNGSAMRISPVGWTCNTKEEVLALAKKSAECTHNHPEGIKGAEATTVAIYMAKTGRSISEIKEHIHQHYYPMDFTLNSIRDSYTYNGSCQGTVPQAIMAFLESNSFEDAVRNAVSIGGDSDTLAAITGSIAEAYYGIPAELREEIMDYLDDFQISILEEFKALI